MKREFICAQCGVRSQKPACDINRQTRVGRPVYCSTACSGIARRGGRYSEEWRAKERARHALRLQDPAERLKRRARRAARKAIATGELVRQPCEVCGHSIVEAHHDDYAKPLAIRWLCPRHHRLHHAAPEMLAAGKSAAAKELTDGEPRAQPEHKP